MAQRIAGIKSILHRSPLLQPPRFQRIYLDRFGTGYVWHAPPYRSHFDGDEQLLLCIPQSSTGRVEILPKAESLPSCIQTACLMSLVPPRHHVSFGLRRSHQVLGSLPALLQTNSFAILRMRGRIGPSPAYNGRGSGLWLD